MSTIESQRTSQEVGMLAKVIAGLFVLWIIGFTAGISGAVIHLLLVLIGLLLLGKLLEPKRLQ